MIIFDGYKLLCCYAWLIISFCSYNEHSLVVGLVRLKDGKYLRNTIAF